MLRFNLTLAFFIFLAAVTTNAQSSSFTYQGKLNDNNTAANGAYEMQFSLFDGNGNQIGTTNTVNNVSVTNGIFTVRITFGILAFDGNPRFLEIGVRPVGSQNPFTVLAPRQPVLSSPYAIRSLSAANADVSINSNQLGGITANQYVLTTDTRMSDARDPLPGSGNYIQNTTNAQFSANFNISGEGKANVFSAATQFNIGANRVLTVNSTRSIFAGIGAGESNTTSDGNSFFGRDSGFANTIGSFNSFFGLETGFANTTGSVNSFFGSGSGRANTSGINNAFFGADSGRLNTTGEDNSFFGTFSGRNNTIGTDNSFFGILSGSSNTSGSGNSFFGAAAGYNNISGNSNAFFGRDSGVANTTGSNNSFFGLEAGFANTVGTNNAYFGYGAGRSNTVGNSNSIFGSGAGLNNTAGNNAFFGTSAGTNNTTGAANTFIGVNAGLGNTIGSSNTLLGNSTNLGANNLTFASAIGAGATVSTSNTLVLGRSADTVQIPGSLNIAGTFGANIFNAGVQYNIGGNRIFSAGGTNNLFAGFNSGANNTGGGNAFFGSQSGQSNTSGINNAFFGFNAGSANNGGGANTFIGVNAGIANVGSSNNTFIGANAGNTSLTGNGNTYLGANSDGALLITNSVAIGQKAFVGQSNALILGSINGVNTATADTDVGIGTPTPLARFHVVGNSIFTGSIGIGTTTPQSKLNIKDINAIPLLIEGTSVNGTGIELVNTTNAGTSRWQMNAEFSTLSFENPASQGSLLSLSRNGGNGNGTVTVFGDFLATSTVSVGALANGQNTSVCWNSANRFLGTCSSSIRYKKDIQPFNGGLSMLNQFKPVTFRWKSDDMPDVGFVAEDVAKIEPLLTTTNADGLIEGVKYDRISAILVNAVKEQQAQIEQMRALIKEQQTQIEQMRQNIGELTKSQAQTPAEKTLPK